MDQLDAALVWLSGLPYGVLIGAMAALAAIENIFPPIPADVLVAFGAFLAARAGTSPIPAFVAVWMGNMLGASVMYGLGRRYGADRVERRYHLDRTGHADQTMLTLYHRWGTISLFASRFIPGVRAVVPPIAGAMRIPFPRAILAIGLASAIWYGAATWIAFRVGSNWGALRAALGRFGLWTAAGAALVMVVGATVIWRRRRR